MSSACWPPAIRRRSCCKATPGWNLTTSARAWHTPDASSDTNALNRRSSSHRAREGSARRLMNMPISCSGYDTSSRPLDTPRMSTGVHDTVMNSWGAIRRSSPALRGTDRRSSCRACDRPRPSARGFGIPQENGPRRAAAPPVRTPRRAVPRLRPSRRHRAGRRERGQRIRGAIERLRRTDGVGSGRTASAHIDNGNIIPGVESH